VTSGHVFNHKVPDDKGKPRKINSISLMKKAELAEKKT